MSIPDVVTIVKAQLYERANSPLLASFALSWSAFNYKFFVVILSSANIEERLRLLDTVVFPPTWDTALRTAIYPLLAAAFFLFVYPYPAKFVFSFWRSRQRELKEVQQKIDDEMPLTREEGREIRLKATQQQLDFDKQLEGKEAQIQRYKELFISRDSLQSAVPKKAIDDLDAQQHQILEQIARSKGANANLVEREGASDRVKRLHDIDQLLERGFITREFEGDGEPLFASTALGRSFLIKRRVVQ